MISIQEEKKESKYTSSDMISGEILEAFEPTARETDVFIPTVPKTGQTWLMNLMYHLKTKGKYPDMEGKNMMELIPWIEIPMNFKTLKPYNVQERIKELESYESPRIFKLHVNYDDIPRSSNTKSKIITITRDPRDLPFSFYRHIKSMHDLPGKPPLGTFEEYFEMYMEEAFLVHWMKSFWPHRNDDDVLWLRYEDMKADIEGCARKIVQFCGWENDITEDEFQKALEYSSFGHMKKVEKKTILKDAAVFKEGTTFLGKGEVGKNKEHLTPEMKNRLITLLKSELPEDAIEWLFPNGTD